MSKTVTIVGGAMGVLAFLAMVIGFIRFCKSQNKNISNRNSDTGSSDPSARGKVSCTTKLGEKFSGNSFHASLLQLLHTFIIQHSSGVE